MNVIDMRGIGVFALPSGWCFVVCGRGDCLLCMLCLLGVGSKPCLTWVYVARVGVCVSWYFV